MQIKVRPIHRPSEDLPLCPPPNLAPDRVNATFYDPMAEPFARLEPVLELHPLDLAAWDDGIWADPMFSRRCPEDLDEAWPYHFQVSGDSLKCSTPLIISDGAWYHGKVVGRAKMGRTRVEMVGKKMHGLRLVLIMTLDSGHSLKAFFCAWSSS